jgi:ATP-dependent DNA helicase DinG
MALLNAASLLETTLAAIKDAPPEVENVVRRTSQLKGDLEFIMSCSDPTYIYWYERRGRGVFLQATPIDVSEILADRLFDQVQTAILTSATLTSSGSFDFIKSRLGIKNTRELIVPSHFDFSRQAILYLPKAMPDPRDAKFTDVAVEEIIRILEITRGRAFVLCTAVHQMNQLYERVSQRVDFRCFVQGQGSKTGLLEKFRTTPHAVLFATTSFWQGVDVQGDALSCVIIDRLPFAVPTDPVIAARQRYLEQMGRNSFYEYSVPQAVIMLKQGLGRLIRSTSDVGVLSILDPRIRTKSYGMVFLQSLPACPVTTKFEEVGQIFDRAPSEKTGE